MQLSSQVINKFLAHRLKSHRLCSSQMGIFLFFHTIFFSVNTVSGSTQPVGSSWRAICMVCYASLHQSHQINVNPLVATIHYLYDDSNYILEVPGPHKDLPILVHLTKCTTEVMKYARSIIGREKDSSETGYLRKFGVCFLYVTHINVNW